MGGQQHQLSASLSSASSTASNSSSSSSSTNNNNHHQLGGNTHQQHQQQQHHQQQQQQFNQSNGLLAVNGNPGLMAVNGVTGPFGQQQSQASQVTNQAANSATSPSPLYTSPIENLSVFFNQHHHNLNHPQQQSAGVVPPSAAVGFVGGFASKLSELQQAYNHPYTSLVSSMISGLAGNSVVAANTNQQTTSVGF